MAHLTYELNCNGMKWHESKQTNGSGIFQNCKNYNGIDPINPVFNHICHDFEIKMSDSS